MHQDKVGLLVGAEHFGVLISILRFHRSVRALIKDSLSPYLSRFCLKVQGCQQKCVIMQFQHDSREIPIIPLNKRGVKRQ